MKTPWTLGLTVGEDDGGGTVVEASRHCQVPREIGPSLCWGLNNQGLFGPEHEGV
jgi:hypothetical protein